jgi:hypothetical protein
MATLTQKITALAEEVGSDVKSAQARLTALESGGGVSLSTANTWTAGQRGAIVALVSGTTIALDLALGNNFSLTLSHLATLANPTNIVPGQSGVIAVTQGGPSGGWTLSYGSYYKFASGGMVPILTKRLAAVDYLTYYVETSERIYVSLTGDVT